MRQISKTVHNMTHMLVVPITTRTPFDNCITIFNDEAKIKYNKNDYSRLFSTSALVITSLHVCKLESKDMDSDFYSKHKNYYAPIRNKKDDEVPPRMTAEYPASWKKLIFGIHDVAKTSSIVPHLPFGHERHAKYTIREEQLNIHEQEIHWSENKKKSLPELVLTCLH